MLCRGVQKARQGDCHLSVTSSQLKMKALRYFKNARPLTTLQHKQWHNLEHSTIQEKTSFYTSQNSKQKSILSSIVYFASICSNRLWGCGGRNYESPNEHWTSFLLDSRPVNFASLSGLQFLTCISSCCRVSGCVWVWNLVTDIAGGKEVEGVWE